jgi:hypothetical protein
LQTSHVTIEQLSPGGIRMHWIYLAILALLGLTAMSALIQAPILNL